MVRAVMAGPQHVRALAKANRVRSEAAELKGEVRAGDLTITKALFDPRADAIDIFTWLRQQRGWGGTRASSFLAQLRISEKRRVSHLTGRQRRLILRELERRSVRHTLKRIEGERGLLRSDSGWELRLEAPGGRRAERAWRIFPPGATEPLPAAFLFLDDARQHYYVLDK